MSCPVDFQNSMPTSGTKPPPHAVAAQTSNMEGTARGRTIWCLIERDLAVFPVVIDDANNECIVDDLKTLVYRQGLTDNDRSYIACDSLTLWKLKDPEPIEPGLTLWNRILLRGSDLPQFAVYLENLVPLSNYFQSQLGDHMLDIIVRLPSSTDDFNLPVIERGLSDNIARFLIANIQQLPSWQHGSGAIRKRIEDLCIPHLHGHPSLLLYGLGRSSLDLKLNRLVTTLFSFEPHIWHTTYLCNTAGSGKTRLLFEGLRTHWGFYFAAYHDHGVAASVDLSCVLADLKNYLTTLTPENRLLAERANTGISAHWLRSILYARILVFRIFLTHAIKLGRISESLKHSWLLLQVAPRMCLGDPDIFQHLTLQVAHNIPPMLLALRFGQELDQVRNILGSSVPLFCVLDDAQVLSDKFTGCLVSREEPRQSQPFYCNLLETWLESLEHIIISGRQLSIRSLEPTCGNALIKGGRKSRTFTEFGAFNSDADLERYVGQFLSRELLSTGPGKRLMRRMQSWWSRRYGLMAAFLLWLVKHSFESSHIPDAFLKNIMPIYPRNDDHLAEGDVTHENKLEILSHTFDYSGLQEDNVLLSEIARSVLDYTFTGKPRMVHGPSAGKLVERGFARFFQGEVAIIDEPLALLVAGLWLSSQMSWSLQYLLSHCLSSLKPGDHGLAFERFGTFLLGMAFHAPINLSSVFSFVSPDASHHHSAHLVAASRNKKNKLIFNPVGEDKPRFILGHSACDELHTLSWLQDPNGIPFCFPRKSVGPHAIFLLQLWDLSVLRVLVQFRRVPESINATIDSGHLVSDFTMSPKIREALDNLKPRSKIKDDGRDFRVLVLYPARPDPIMLERLVNSKDMPQAQLPDAIVDLRALLALNRTPMSIVLNLLSVAVEKSEQFVEERLGKDGHESPLG